MSVHVLKTWPEPFKAIFDGRKRHEIRRDDRSYAIGDLLVLREWDPTRWEIGIPEALAYTDREIKARITYKTPGGAWGLPDGLCVLSIEVEP